MLVYRDRLETASSLRARTGFLSPRARARHPHPLVGAWSVIHVATVHHKSAQWIDVQLDYLRRHLHEPYRVVANLEGVEHGHDSKFDRVVPAIGRHSGKLDYLAAEIVGEADPDDLLMFLDGDAFPIAFDSSRQASSAGADEGPVRALSSDVIDRGDGRRRSGSGTHTHSTLATLA